MKKPIDRTHLLRIAGTLLAIALLIYLLSHQGWQSILDATRQIPLGVLAACFGLVLISRLAVALRWHVLLRQRFDDPTLADRPDYICRAVRLEFPADHGGW